MGYVRNTAAGTVTGEIFAPHLACKAMKDWLWQGIVFSIHCLLYGIYIFLFVSYTYCYVHVFLFCFLHIVCRICRPRLFLAHSVLYM